MDSNEIIETDNAEHGFLNVSVKEELLDLDESVPYDVTIKDEPEDIKEFEDTITNFGDKNVIYVLEKTCSETPNSDNDEKVNVQCPRCKISVLMDNFREHIDLCPPRKKYEYRIAEADCTKDEHQKLNNGKDKVNEDGVDSNAPKVENHASQKLVNIRNKSSINQTLENSKLSDGAESVSINVDKRDETFDGSLLLQDNTFSCSLCSYTTDKLRNLRDHERSHRIRNQPISKCVYCNQKYTNYALYLHIRKVHPGQKFVLVPDDGEEEIAKDVDTAEETKQAASFSCPICSYTTDKRRDLRQHKRTHRISYQPMSKCVYCNQKYMNNALHLHIREMHPGQKFVLMHDNGGEEIAKDIDTAEETKQATSFSCPICSYTTDKQKNLREHKRAHRTHQKPIYRCVYCNQKYCQYLLYLHVRRMHPDKEFVLPKGEKVPKDFLGSSLKQEPSNEAFSCSICSYTTDKQKNLRQHKHAHRVHQKPIYQCVYCNQKYCQYLLYLHVRKMHPNKEFVLPKGEKVPKVFLGSSLKQEPSNEAFSCSICSYTTHNERNLRNHKRDHRSQKQPILQCVYCDKKYTQYWMGLHIRKVHPGQDVVLPNEGELIPKDIDPFNETRRIKKQTFFKCQKCSFYAKTKVLLTKHVTKNHSDVDKSELFQCNKCSYSTRRRYDFLKHQALHRKNLPVVKCSWCDYRSFVRGVWIHRRKCSKKNRNDDVPIETSADADESSNNKDSENDHKHDDVPIEKSAGADGSCNDKHSEHDNTTVPTETSAGANESSSNKDSENDDKQLNDDNNCKSCSLRCMTIAALKMHMRCHVGKQPIKQCSVCDFKSTPACLREHVREQGHYSRKGFNPLKKLKCSLCSVLFGSQRGLSLHLKDHAQNPTKKCSRCNFKSTATYLAKHVQEKQHYAKKFQCTLCPFSTSLRIRLNMHTKKRHPEDPKKTKSKRKIPQQASKPAFSCKFCSYTTDFEFVWEKHVQSHTIYNKPIYQCLECGFKGTKIKIASHKTCAQPPKKVLFSCAQCSFTTHFPAAQSAHEKNDHGDAQTKTVKLGAIKSFQCELCSFSTYWQYLFEKHMDSHTVLKLPVEQCPNCEFRSTPACLTAHTKKCVKTTPQKRGIRHST